MNMWLILLLLWVFDIITFKSAILYWLIWVAISIAYYAVAGTLYYNFLIAPILEMFQ